MSIPVVEAVPSPKKSKILLPSMVFAVLIVLAFVVVPTAEMPFSGKLLPAGPMLFLEMTLLILPNPGIGGLQGIDPYGVPSGTRDEPSRLAFWTVLFCAPLMKRI